MNKNIKLYFDSHTGTDVFYFTTDGQAFFTEAGANAHAPNLEKKQKGAGAIEMVTRTQVNEWWSTAALQFAADAEKAVVTAEINYEAAQKTLANLPKNVNLQQKAAANKAVNDANEQVNKATLEFEQAHADAEKVKAMQPVVEAEEDPATDGDKEPSTEEPTTAPAEKVVKDEKKASRKA